MKLFIIRVLLRLLHIGLKPVDSHRVKIFLWTAHPQQGFQDYIIERDMSILQSMGNALSREDYLIALGQRIELGMLKTTAKNTFEKVDKERKAKIEAIKLQAAKRVKNAEKKKPKISEDTKNEAD